MLSTIPIIAMVAWSLSFVAMSIAASIILTAVFGAEGRFERYLGTVTPGARSLIRNFRDQA